MRQCCRSFKQAIPNLSVTAQGRNLKSGRQSIKSYGLRILQRLKFSLARTYTIFDCFEQCRLRFISPTRIVLEMVASAEMHNKDRFCKIIAAVAFIDT